MANWLALPLNVSACVCNAGLENTSFYHPKSQKVNVANSLKQVLNERVRQRLATSVHQPCYSCNTELSSFCPEKGQSATISVS